MYVSVQHRIKDREAFFTRGDKLIGQVPDGVRPLQFYPSTDASSAVCLWQAQTLEAVQRHIDGVLGETADQEYFPIDTEHAMGLPA